MVSPALSFEAIITAMMCLCSSEDNTQNNMYKTTDDIPEIYQRSLIEGGGESISFDKSAVTVTEFIDKIDSLEKTFAEIQSLQEKIMRELNISSKSDVPIGEGSMDACTSKKQITNIKIPQYPHPIRVLCNSDGWLVIQQRFDGSIDFFKDWAYYERGFGSLEGEFFLGLDKIHAITKAKTQELRIEMEDFEENRRFAHYDQFEIGSANEGYALKVLGTFDGDAGDSLRRHVTHKFSTYDRDNDIFDGECAVEYTGAWWYDECETSNLNGQYLKGALHEDKYGKGMSWDTFKGLGYSLKSVKMMIKNKK